MTFYGDISRIETIVFERDLSFATVARDRLKDDLETLRGLSKHSEADRFLLSAMRLLALPGNGHTRLIPNTAIKTLPLRFVALGEDVYLTFAPPEHHPSLDNKLVAVNTVPIEDIRAKSAPFLAGTPQRQRAIGALLFAWPAALQSMGAGSDDTCTIYTLADEEGRRSSLTGFHDSFVPAGSIYPLTEKGLLQPVDRREPTYLAFKDIAPGAWYLELRDFYDPAGHILDAQIETAAKQFVQRSDHDLIIDLRGNPGGNFLRGLPLLKVIAEKWRGRHCAVLIDKFTFSAAIVFVALLKNTLQSAVSLVGEEMGDHTRFFAEGDLAELPETGAAVRYSTAYHDWETGVVAPSLPSEIAAHLVAVGTLLPDRRINITARDMRLGRDPQLDAALEVIS